ncbi:uncharacterized protein LOC116308736, partial [Actinia tenebrosa]|uniref:Uncharacterized protein LOC116308736 n=1 Tax=Actinia tenebrosa TaxID=6105 RepID=A0A6P8J4U5_ACTTE
MAEAKYSIGHSRKPKGKIGVGGQPVHSWDNDIELQPTSSLGSATSAQNTSYNGKDSSRHVVAQTWLGGSKEAFNPSRKKDKDSSFATANFLSNKNAPIKVTVTGEWALQECEEFTNWTNLLMRRGRYRPVSDIRRSVGDGVTLVHMLEIL